MEIYYIVTLNGQQVMVTTNESIAAIIAGMSSQAFYEPATSAETQLIMLVKDGIVSSVEHIKEPKLQKPVQETLDIWSKLGLTAAGWFELSEENRQDLSQNAVQIAVALAKSGYALTDWFTIPTKERSVLLKHLQSEKPAPLQSVPEEVPAEALAELQSIVDGPADTLQADAANAVEAELGLSQHEVVTVESGTIKPKSPAESMASVVNPDGKLSKPSHPVETISAAAE